MILSTIRDALARATKGPWTSERQDGDSGDIYFAIHGGGYEFITNVQESPKAKHDARLIVLLRNHAEALIEAAETLDEALTMLEYRIAIDSDKVFDAAQEAFGQIVVGQGAREAWAETAPKVVKAARAALAALQEQP